MRYAWLFLVVACGGESAATPAPSTPPPAPAAPPAASSAAAEPMDASPAPPPALTASAAPEPSPSPMTAKQLAGDGGLEAEYKVAGGPMKLGSRAREDVQSVLSTNLRAIALQCVPKATKKNANLKGRLDVKVAVDAEGKVTSATSASAKDIDAELISCTLGLYKKLRFPKGDKAEGTHAIFFGADAVGGCEGPMCK